MKFNTYKFGVTKNVQSILLQFQAHVTKKIIGTRKVKRLSLNRNHNKTKPWKMNEFGTCLDDLKNLCTIIHKCNLVPIVELMSSIKKKCMNKMDLNKIPRHYTCLYKVPYCSSTIYITGI
jgi:hypothetical protein